MYAKPKDHSGPPAPQTTVLDTTGNTVGHWSPPKIIKLILAFCYPMDWISARVSFGDSDL